MNYALIIKIIALCLISFLLCKGIDKGFQHREQLHIKFIRSFLKILVVIICLVMILNNFESYQKFSQTILTSSSLLVVVIGFAFQTSLADFIAGILISLFKPFEINDRIILKESSISGTVEDFTIRHTVIRTFTNSRVIIPNSVMNKELIENNHMVDARSGNFLDVTIDYNADVAKAKAIIQKCIEEHPNTINIKEDELTKGYTYVYTREFLPEGISLRANVWTTVVDENFIACSEIRDKIIQEFKANDIKIPYPYLEVIQQKQSTK